MKTTKKHWMILGSTLAVSAMIAAAGIKVSQHQSAKKRNPAAFDTLAGWLGMGTYKTWVPDSGASYDKLTPSEKVGKEIWYKATGGNARFHNYSLQQKLGVYIDWYRTFNTEERYQRFSAWGLINDPSCCTPGEDKTIHDRASGQDISCAQISKLETFGYDWCEGDGLPSKGVDGLLAYIGKPGYKDPACDLQDAPSEGHKRADPSWDPTSDPQWKFREQHPCSLQFGTSAGAMGYRKFPNPKFDAERWQRIGGYDGFRKVLTDNANLKRLADGSIEPPFIVGNTCASCHASLNPLRPPVDPNRPEWANIEGTIGSQYLRNGEILGSGISPHTLEWQTAEHMRPGTVDTSTFNNDFVNNPGTFNAILNFDRRPHAFKHDVIAWRPTTAANPCVSIESEDFCWCEDPVNKPGKCWRKEKKTEEVHQILKGGEDSVGISLALQRVYLNIQSCAESCWLNHLTDNRVLDPSSRNFDQTAIDIGQCRRDCSAFREVEDRIDNIKDFLVTRRPYDLYKSDKFNPKGDLPKEAVEPKIAQLFSPRDTALSHGKEIYQQKCLSCHSSFSQDPSHDLDSTTTVQVKDFDGNIVREEEVREDWLGSDVRKKATTIGTYRCRALHSNHMRDRLYSEFSSETYKESEPDASLKDPNGGGRGYYRAISLLNAWAFAPFMHNNALGPEICSDNVVRDAKGNEIATVNPLNLFYRSPYEGTDKGHACWHYSGGADEDGVVHPPLYSVDGRLALYKASMEQLLFPDRRGPAKITRTDQDILLDASPKIWFGDPSVPPLGIVIKIPAGVSVTKLGSFDFKPFVRDLLLSRSKNPSDKAEFEKRLAERVPPSLRDQVRSGMAATAAKLSVDPEKLAQALVLNPSEAAKMLSKFGKPIEPNMDMLNLYFDAYSNCRADDEAAGHTTQLSGLSTEDKEDLMAYIATF